MAWYATQVESRLSPADAFAYMADFSNARFWDPSVREARRDSEGPVAVGSTFQLVSRFAGRDVPLMYELVAYEPSTRVVLEARKPGFVSRDTITVEATSNGSVVHYEARLELQGARRVFDPVLQRLFTKLGDAATIGLRATLNS
jgi:hypothetical protein